jgi:hypothetical protein
MKLHASVYTAYVEESVIPHKYITVLQASCALEPFGRNGYTVRVQPELRLGAEMKGVLK